MSVRGFSVTRLVTPVLASLAVLLAVTPLTLRAQADLGEPAHGGVVAEAGFFQAEFVDDGSTLTLYLSHHGQPLAIRGGIATITAQGEDKAISVRLLPNGTRFVAPGTLDGTGAKSATAVIALPGMPERTVQFPLE